MNLRSVLDQFLMIAGVIVVVVPVALLTESWTPLIVVIVGIAMIGAGVWRLGGRLLPERRVYVGLRSEVEHFIGLVRRLNTHALKGETEQVEELRERMRESVDRMVSLAGHSGTER